MTKRHRQSVLTLFNTAHLVGVLTSPDTECMISNYDDNEMFDDSTLISIINASLSSVLT